METRYDFELGVDKRIGDIPLEESIHGVLHAVVDEGIKRRLKPEAVKESVRQDLGVPHDAKPQAQIDKLRTCANFAKAEITDKEARNGEFLKYLDALNITPEIAQDLHPFFMFEMLSRIVHNGDSHSRIMAYVEKFFSVLDKKELNNIFYSTEDREKDKNPLTDRFNYGV